MTGSGWTSFLTRPATLGRNVGKRILHRRGLSIVRATTFEPLDLSDHAMDPIEAAHQANGKPFIMPVRLADCRTLGMNGFPCSRNSGDPLVNTLAGYARGETRSYEGSPLEKFYARWQPATWAEAAGVARCLNSRLHVQLDDPPPWPWGAEYAEGDTRHERLLRPGFQEALAASGVGTRDVQGSLYFGPVNRHFGDATLRRLFEVFDSICAEGYHPERFAGGHIRARVLVREGDYRLLIEGGKHRIAALTALDYQSVPILFTHQPVLIHRCDAGSWPNVRRGLYSQSEGRVVFDRLFEGRQPWD